MHITIVFILLQLSDNAFSISQGYAEFFAGPGSTLSCIADGESLPASSSTCIRTPYGIQYNTLRNELYLSENLGNRIRSISLNTFIVKTIAGSVSGISGSIASVTLSMTQFSGPKGIRLYGSSHMYVCDTLNNA
eukprot:PhF_6_TR30838/c0_g1_i1/m.45389